MGGDFVKQPGHGPPGFPGSTQGIYLWKSQAALDAEAAAAIAAEEAEFQRVQRLRERGSSSPEYSVEAESWEEPFAKRNKPGTP
jgi:hypothetical protein